MTFDNQLVAYVVLALMTALVISFLTTPVVKTFAYKVGAIDVPKDARRMHKVPIPRLGGLAIFIGFIEIKSIYEKADDKVKNQSQQVLEMMGYIAGHKDKPEDIAKAVAEYLKKEGGNKK